MKGERKKERERRVPSPERLPRPATAKAAATQRQQRQSQVPTPPNPGQGSAARRGEHDAVRASKQASTPNGRRSFKFRKQRTLATSNTEEKAVNSETSHSFAGTNHSDAATFDIYSVSRLRSRFLLFSSIYRSRWVSRRAYVICTRFEGSVGASSNAFS